MRFAYTVRIDITYYVYNTMCINYYNCLFAIFFFLVASTLTCFRCGPRLVALVFCALRRLCVRVCFHFKGDLYYLRSLGRVFFFSHLAYAIGTPAQSSTKQTGK